MYDRHNNLITSDLITVDRHLFRDDTTILIGTCSCGVR